MFWTIAAVVAALCSAALLGPLYWLRRVPDGRGLPTRMFGAGIVAAALPLGIIVGYLLLGSPMPLRTNATANAAASAAIQWETAGAPSPPAAAAAGDSALEVEAQTARRERDFPRAIAAFERLSAQGGMSADLWADYADAVGAGDGGLAKAEPQILRALALDARHAKALWLLGSLQTEKGDTAAALATWNTLLAVLPEGSSDAKLVADNRREAQALLAGGGAGSGGSSSWAWSPRTPAP